MIARIEGLLESVDKGAVLVRPGARDNTGGVGGGGAGGYVGGGLTYEVLVPAFAGARLGLMVGQVVTLETMAFLESQNQGASFTPRLAGFLTVDDRAFFELLTTCKGIGNRKALRAMALDCGQIAGAIADRDVALLQSLPEIGKRTAETVVATLHGKVERFISAGALAMGSSAEVAGDGGDAGGQGAKPHAAGRMAREALEVLLTLGENRVQAVEWIDTVLRDNEDRPSDVEALVQRVYAKKSGG